ncbi:aspartate aminotransferase [Sporobacter termitidis DSM 10068]|uniref:Aspartate aminotransferase n=1 Tax=Sporobacter termitidis DSM 10068 TaxID=1123282 RepID=A0A1M5WY65_9FIRM|nr:pyridoxal phosphate-dependent aminotransferase [Sporobacter termitidis]SHH92248.1 aspartate aminotransferase [Sporobacter termitidis DSM 10068]
MISEKMMKLAQNNSAIRAMFEEGNRLAAQYGRENVYDFSLGNPNFPAPAAVKKAIVDVLDREDAVFVHGYMSNAGYESVRGAIADSLNKRFGTAFGDGNIIMSVGAAGGLNVVLRTLLNPGDEVVTFSPYFVEYGNYVRNYDGVLVAVPANTADFQPDPSMLSGMITPKTKALIINSPNNPTGVVYSAESIRKIAAVLEAKQKEYGTSIFIIADEPYRELAYDGVEVPYLTKFYKNTIVCYSWSKSLSLPGERIGYIVIPGEADEYQLVFDAACIATRVLGFVNAPSLQQLAVARCLEETTDVGAYDTNRKLLYKGLTDCGFTCAFPQGAFYMWMKTPADDREFAGAAKKYNILVVPGTSFGCPGYVRIAYCVAKATIERSLPAFKKLAQEYGL